MGYDGFALCPYILFQQTFSTDGTLFGGTLAHLISFGAEQFADFHHYAEPIFVFGAATVLSAMGVYFGSRKNLIPPMITGELYETSTIR